jgi:hypothetical protein
VVVMDWADSPSVIAKSTTIEESGNIATI